MVFQQVKVSLLVVWDINILGIHISKNQKVSLGNLKVSLASMDLLTNNGDRSEGERMLEGEIRKVNNRSRFTVRRIVEYDTALSAGCQLRPTFTINNEALT